MWRLVSLVKSCFFLTFELFYLLSNYTMMLDFTSLTKRTIECLFQSCSILIWSCHCDSHPLKSKARLLVCWELPNSKISSGSSPSPSFVLLGTYSFYSLVSTEVLPPSHENLVRTWDFEFWVAKNNHHHPPPQWKFGQHLELLSVNIWTCLRGWGSMWPMTDQWHYRQ